MSHCLILFVQYFLLNPKPVAAWAVVYLNALVISLLDMCVYV